MRFSDEENEALRDILVQNTWIQDSSVFVVLQNLWFCILCSTSVGINVRGHGEGSQQ